MKFFLIDDHDIVRVGLKLALQELDSSIEFMEARDGKEARQVLTSEPDFDLILIDLFLPDTTGLELLEYIGSQWPDIPVAIISASDEVSDMRRVLDYGASGFIPKTTTTKILLKAVSLILSGGTYIPEHFLNASYQDKNEQSEKNIEELKTLLTKRQIEVLKLIATGQSNKIIAQILKLSENTVKIHVAAIFKILKVKNRTSAVLVAQNSRLL